MTILIRTAKRADLVAVLRLWDAAEAERSHTDDIDGLSRLLDRDPGAIVVAEVEGQIIGSIIAGWDGWRGSIYRLAVHPDHRRRGLAQRLLSEAERRLADLGARRLQAIVVESDARATGFWRASDWSEQVARLRFVRG